jgi:hypothetical protein
MAKICSPNKQYTGISAGVVFSQGVGETTNEYLIDWFKKRGYDVEEDLQVPDSDDSDPGPIDPGNINPDNSDPDNSDPDATDLGELIELDALTAEELIKFAEINSIDIGKATSKEGILKKIAEAAKKIE